MTVKERIKAVAQKMKKNNEDGARKAVLEDLFYDFNRSRPRRHDSRRADYLDFKFACWYFSTARRFL